MSRFILAFLLAAGLVAPATAATVTYVHTDALGSPIMETDSAGNKLSGEVDYRAYGEEVLRAPLTGPAFTGHYRDASTGLVYMQRRYYDPGIGRFISIDPVAADAKQGRNFNRYWYANNNPYRFIDPDGNEGVAITQDADAEAVFSGAMSADQFMENAAARATGAAVGAALVAVGVALSPEVAAVATASTVKAAVTQAAKQTGSYTNRHASGRAYHGKGTRARSQESGRRVEKKSGDKHTSTDWSPAKNSREAFKDESKRLDGDGGPKSESNYNEVESPGKRMRKEDG